MEKSLKNSNGTSVVSDSTNFARALRSAILWPVGLIIFTVLLMGIMIGILLKLVKWSEHSYEVLAQARTCESMLVDTQSDLRGFLLMGQESLPGSFKVRRANVDSAFDKLEHLIGDNPQQKIRFEGLTRDKDSWFDHARMTFDQGPKLSSQPNWIKTGDDLMNNLRLEFQTFTQTEEQFHDQRIGHVQSMRRAVGFAGGTLSLVLVITVGFLVYRQFKQLAVDYRFALHTIEQRHAELLRSEADLEEQKEWFRVTLTSIGDGVIVADRENRVVFMNREAEHLTGWKNVEALLKPLVSVFRVVDGKRKGMEDSGTTALRKNKVGRIDDPALLLSKNGEEWPIDDNSAPIHDSKGTVLGVVLVFRNVTDLRRAQNTLKLHSEDLEKKVAERTTTLLQTVSELESFSYTVSHDLRSPLRAMQGFAQAVLEDYGEKLDGQGRNYLERIKNASERLDRLIQDLLSYTRISRQERPLLSLDLDKLLHELVEHYPNLHPPAAEVKIQGALPRVLGQESSLTQVFSNLLGNAAKFVTTGTSPLIRVWSEDLGPHVRIWVEDNGIGVLPADTERIFQMFVQGNESQLYGGTGVGLAIVKKAVESMHGSVGVVSQSGQGSKFWVELEKAA